MADPRALRPISIHRYPLGSVEARPEIVDPRPTLILTSKDASAKPGSERVHEAARKTLLDAIAGVRRNLRHMADEKPVHLVIGVAIAAFLAGVGLRLWRSHYE